MLLHSRFAAAIRVGILTTGVAVFGIPVALAQGVVPGSGTRITDAGDDFEDAEWAYYPQGPKSSRNIDKRERHPTGGSKNGLWSESAKRGHPDVIQRIDTPDGGLPESKGALMLQTRKSGIPNRPTMQQQQDDLIMNFEPSSGGTIPVSWSPSIVIRVCMPEFKHWEKRTGASFGWRASMTGIGPLEEKKTRRRGFGGLFGRRRRRSPGRGVDAFYPGMFIQFNSKVDSEEGKESAVFVIRGDDHGQDVMGPKITQTGWWTLGMSFTPDGRVHYYASPGVDDLTPEDHIASHFSQSVRCQHFNTMFFNVVNNDDGRSWSTPWVIDDPAVYSLHNPSFTQGESDTRRQ